MRGRHSKLSGVRDSLIILHAEPISRKAEIIGNRMLLLRIFLRNPMIAEKKMIKDETVMEEMPAFLMESIKLKLCLELMLDLFDILDFGLNDNPIIIAERITEKYSIMPIFILPKRPAPTPEITNATDGLLQIADKNSSSELSIIPWSYLSFAIFVPSGKPHRLPIIKAVSPSPEMLNVFERKDSFDRNIVLHHRSDNIKKGKSVGIMLNKHILNP